MARRRLKKPWYARARRALVPPVRKIADKRRRKREQIADKEASDGDGA